MPPTDEAPKRVLLTGATGFLGEHVLARLERDCRVVTVRGREADEAGVAALDPQVVVHLAALTDPDVCERYPEAAHEANVEVTRRLAQGAARERLERFVYASTDLVFDGNGGLYREQDEPRPICVYGRTKLEGERAAREVLGNRVVTLRIALLYGPRASEKSRACFAETMIRRARAGETVSLFVDQFRSPLYVEDACETIARIVSGGASDRSQALIHLGGEERCSRYDLGRLAFDVFDLPPELATPVRMSDLARVNGPSSDSIGALRPADVSLDRGVARALRFPARSLREGLLAFRDRMKEPGFH